MVKFIIHPLLLTIYVAFSNARDFEITATQLGFDTSGILAGFGDYNGDKLVDVFVISQSGDSVDVLLVTGTNTFTRQNLYNLTSETGIEFISGIMIADFDGDVRLDVLMSINQTASSRIVLEMLWGNDSKVTERFDGEFLDEPVLFDYNGDMLPDLLVEKTTGEWLIFLSTHKTHFQQLNPLHRSPLIVPQSSAFVALLNTYAANVFITTKTGFEIYDNVTMNAVKQYNFSTGGATIFASSFGDFNQDGQIEHIVPVCTDDGCTINVFDYAKDQWFTVLSAFGNDDDDDWVFQEITFNGFLFLPKLHVGDYNLDGYPDILTVLSSPTQGNRAFILMNIACDSDNDCAEYGRQFELVRGSLPIVNNTLTASFIDMNEDGTLDIALSAIETSSSSNSKVVFLVNIVAADTTFLKVTVFSGQCSSNCPNGQLPYSMNVPGPTIKYNTTSPTGSLQSGAAGQLSQSAHFALQLPYAMFGLGQTPNFVDAVGVGIPNTVTNHQMPRYRVWLQIIPNSQLIINPFPPNYPSQWSMTLLLMPSQKVWYTGIALAGTCLFGAIIVIAFHLHERSEDNKEKKQESQKFHFDAM